MPDKFKQLRALRRRDGVKCFWCDVDVFSRQTIIATREHLIPASLGGKNHMENLVLACRCCNQARASADATAWFFLSCYVLHNQPWLHQSEAGLAAVALGARRALQLVHPLHDLVQRGEHERVGHSSSPPNMSSWRLRRDSTCNSSAAFFAGCGSGGFPSDGCCGWLAFFCAALP